MTVSDKTEVAKWTYKEVSVEDGPEENCEIPKKSWLDYTGEYKAVFAAAMAMVCAGSCFQWAGPALPQLLSPDSPIYMTSDQAGYVSSFLQVGAMPGAIIAAISADYIGRRKAIISLAFPFLAGQLLLGVATTVNHLYIARIVSGFSVGAAFALVPMYISEVSSPSIRGILGTGVGMFNNMGGLSQYLIGLFNTIQVTGQISAIGPILFLILAVWIPESPYYCLMVEDRKSAERSLQYLRGTKDVKKELNRLQKAVQLQKKERVNALDLVTNRLNLKVLGIVTGLFIFQQTAGVVPIFSYSQVIFNKVDMQISPNTCGIALSLMNFLVTIVVASVVDYFGRRQLYLFSAISCIIPLGGFGLFFYLLDQGYDLSAIAMTPVFALVIFKFTWGLGLGTLPYICSGELLPTTVKAAGSCYISVLGSFIGFMVMKVFQLATDEWGYPAPFFFFAGCCLMAAWFVYFILPETRGRTLEEIQEDLRRK